MKDEPGAAEITVYKRLSPEKCLFKENIGELPG